MSETTNLIVIKKTNALALFTNNDQLDPIIEAIEKEARSFVHDVSTKKGRDAIASMAHKIARSKTHIDNAGKELVADLKALPKQIDESRRKMRERLDALKDEVRQPLTEWEAEQERLYAEEEARIAAEELAKRIETDHEIAILMNRELDREKEEEQQKAKQAQLEREEHLKREAAEQAKKEAEEKALREIADAARRESEAKAAAERSERERLEAEQRAEREKREAAELAEREKLAAIEEERRKATAAANRIREEAEQKELARRAEEKRKADEENRRIADVEHRQIINRKSVGELIANGIPEECAKKCVEAIAKNLISHLKIHY